MPRRQGRVEIMSSGERMVWAQVYAENFIREIFNVPILPDTLRAREDWKTDTAANAAELACIAVMKLRQLEPTLSRRFGEAEEVGMWRAMVEDGE